jgi:hypothetical protein
LENIIVTLQIGQTEEIRLRWGEWSDRKHIICRVVSVSYKVCHE